MKKTISINISGILFHIEEDGYTSLKKYLDSINKHFSHYEDNHEIISDIENRIAEIFLSNLKNNKQVITAENVENLIEKMGTIADFKAVEEEILPHEEEATKETENDFYKYITPPGQESGKGYKKLSRLENRKILGGVCAGFAHYLAVDPLWTRLIAILLLFSGGIAFKSSEIFFLPGAFNFKFSFGVWTAVAYILLWIILPVSYEEPEDKNIKKLYRNPDDRVLGGVSSGLAAYFNIEVLWIRLLFVGLVFAGGSGIVIYLILWIITPLAQSITERIKMKGGEITLSNIENTIKENMAPPYIKEESQTRKILLAPFRFIGAVINGIGIALGPFGRFLLDVVRVAFGLLIFFMGMVIILVPILFLGVYFELLVGDSLSGFMDAVPLEMMAEFMPVWLAIALSIAILIPGIILTLSGISVVIKKSVIDSRFGLVAFGIWILSIMICAFQIPKVAAQFQNEATYVHEETIGFSEGTWLIKSNPDRKTSGDFGQVSITLQGTENEQANLMQRFKAKGKSFDDALKNAEDIKYNFQVKDTVINFDRRIEFASIARFRGQNLNQTLEIPYDQPFVLDKSIIPIIRNTIYKNGYKVRDINNRNHWVFNEGGLLCINCVNDHKNSEQDSISRSKFSEAYFMRK